MRICLSVEIEEQLLLDLRRYFQMGLETVRQDLNEALTQTVAIYQRDVERKKQDARRRRLSSVQKKG